MKQRYKIVVATILLATVSFSSFAVPIPGAGGAVVFPGSPVFDAANASILSGVYSTEQVQQALGVAEENRRRIEVIREIRQFIDRTAQYVALVGNTASTAATMAQATQMLASGDWEVFKQGLVQMTRAMGESAQIVQDAADTELFAELAEADETGVAREDELVFIARDLQTGLSNISLMIDVTERTVESTVQRMERIGNITELMEGQGAFVGAMQVTSQLMGEVGGQLGDLTMLTAAAQRATEQREQIHQAELKIYQQWLNAAAGHEDNPEYQTLLNQIDEYQAGRDSGEPRSFSPLRNYDFMREPVTSLMLQNIRYQRDDSLIGRAARNEAEDIEREAEIARETRRMDAAMYRPPSAANANTMVEEALSPE